MRKLKKILAVVLSVAMISATSICSFADVQMDQQGTQYVFVSEKTETMNITIAAGAKFKISNETNSNLDIYIDGKLVQTINGDVFYTVTTDINTDYEMVYKKKSHKLMITPKPFGTTKSVTAGLLMDLQAGKFGVDQHGNKIVATASNSKKTNKGADLERVAKNSDWALLADAAKQNGYRIINPGTMDASGITWYDIINSSNNIIITMCLVDTPLAGHINQVYITDGKNDLLGMDMSIKSLIGKIQTYAKLTKLK